MTLCQVIKQHKKDKMPIYYNANNREWFINYFSNIYHNSLFIIKIK